MRRLDLCCAAVTILALSACQGTFPTRTVHVNSDAANLATVETAAAGDAAATAVPLLAEIAVHAQGTSVNGVFPELQLLLDGEPIGAIHVNDEPTRYVFMAPVPESAGPHQVEVRFANDYGTPTGGDRNLFVDGITVNGTLIASDSGTVAYHRKRDSGVEVMDGRRNLWWNGSLIFPVPAPLLAPPAASG